MKYLALAAPAILALAACGANSANLGGSDTDFEELFAESVALTERLKDDNLLPTQTLPSETVSYNGVAVVTEDFASSDVGVIGDVAMTVNFGTSSLTGNVDSFYTVPIVAQVPEDGSVGVAVPGSLMLSSNNVDLAFLMDVSGNVTLDGTLQPFQGTLASGFLGESAEVFAADSTHPSSTSTHDIVITASSD